MSFPAVTVLHFGSVTCDHAVVKAGGVRVLKSATLPTAARRGRLASIPPSGGSRCRAISFFPRESF